MADLPSSSSHARALAQAASALAEKVDPALTTDRICGLAVELVRPCAHASISIRARRGRPRTLAASSSVAERVDAAQYELGQGPNLTAIDENRTLVLQDLGTEGEWPDWTALAREAGINSLMCVRLIGSRQQTIGAMTLYSEAVGPWDDETFELAKLYATHAAIAMNHAQVADGLHTALASRHLIGLAQGVLMTRHQLSATQAFAVLQKYSSESNVKVADVARDIVADLDPTYAPPA